MPAPTVSPLPEFPTFPSGPGRPDQPGVFFPKILAVLSALQNWPGELSALVTYLEGLSGGGGGSVSWGDILGTLTDQADLVAALADKQAAHANLDTFAGITPSADVQSLLAGTDYAAIKTLLGLDIGTELIVAMSDETTALTVADGKIIIHAPYDFDLLDIMLGISTVSSSGAVTIDIEVAGSTVFTTKPSIAAGDDHSTDASSTDAILTSTPLAVTKGQKIAFNQDAAGTGAKGAKAYLILRRTA